LFDFSGKCLTKRSIVQRLPWTRVRKGVDFWSMTVYPAYGTPFIRAYAPSFLGQAEWEEVANYFGLFRGWEERMKPPKKEDLPNGGAMPVEGVLSAYPTLWEYLSATKYDTEPPTPRQTSTLLLFVQDGQLKFCLRDRQEQRCLWIAALTLEDGLDALEEDLNSPLAVWRADRASGAAEASRQKPPGKRP